MRTATISTVSHKGQTVIPKPMRERYHLEEGTFIQWEPREDGVLLRRVTVRPESEERLTEREWKKLDHLIRSQRRRGEFTAYTDIEQAKQHSRRLLRR